MKAYKLFRIKDGKLYPLYIYANEEVPIGVRLEAKAGEFSKDGKHVKSKLGDLAYRPGWHSCSLPVVQHIGKKTADGKLVQAANTVWCEVDISDDIDYNPMAIKAGTNKDGKIVPVKCCLKEIPTNGWYSYRTNPLAVTDWYISGSITVNKILSNKEVFNICISNGVEPQAIEVA